MSDPTRLFDGAGTDDERRLIALARRDTPPAGSIARTLSVLGVAGGVLAPAAAHAAALGSASAAGTGALGTTTAGTSITLLTVAKWLAVGIAGGALTATATTLVNRSSHPSSSPATFPTSVASTERHARAIASSPERDDAAPLPSLSEPSRTPAIADESRDRLIEELALLERARRSLAQGRSDDAREALRRHRETFPSGTLSEEADVLRIEVLLARGEPTLAEQAGRDFLDAHPGSPHAPRVRELIVRAAGDPKRSPLPSGTAGGRETP